MATVDNTGPSEVERFEAQAEAGPGSNTTTVDQTASTVNTETEKAMNGAQLSPSDSSEATLASPDQEPQRSTGKVVLLMGALCVCGQIRIPVIDMIYSTDL